MPPNSEIEKLERRWRENPKGTVFAPYAEVLRKNGDHELAKDILRQGLELHPDHIPGNIVLGRCSLDLGEDGPAEKAFSHVLELDPENVIALKALADITERQGRLAEARQWLVRLVAVDPSNDEARDQMARVEAAQQAAATAITSAVQVTPEVEDTVEIIPPPLPSTVKTREIEVFARPKEGPLAEPDRAESGGGLIRDVEPARIVDDVDATFDKLVPVIETPVGHLLDPSEVKTAEIEPLMPPVPAKIMDLEPVELDITEAAKAIESAPLAGMEVGEEFVPPDEKPAIELRAAGVSEFQAPDAANDLLDITPAGKSEFQAPDASNELLDIKPASHSEFQAPDASNELLDITPASHSEFQAPDASNELLDLSPSGRSEFQEPDASQELMSLSGSASSEYQTPSGSEDLLDRMRQAKAPEPEPVAVEPPRFARDDAPSRVAAEAEPEPVMAPLDPEPEETGGPSLIADLDALTTAPTAEIATAMLPAIEEPAASATEAPEAVDLTEPVRAEEELTPAPAAPDWLFADSSEHTAIADEPAIAEPAAQELAVEEAPVEELAEASVTHLPGDLDDDFAEPLAEDQLTEVASGRISEEKPSGDLKLIFPDDAAQPEPHQVRRITQEVELPAMAGDIDEHEPEPIVTESMAELYARQGHTSEALKVYRTLAERSPHDARLRERIAELEVRQPQAPRRMTYVAIETGGESVESFFRSLADSRPGGQRASMHATGQIPDDDGGAAPTRPARDPLSLSAIFGEDPAAAKASAAPVAPSGNSGADAFSFDQFFGSTGGGAQAPARPDGPAGEDLDQFQHWLKSLKK